MFSKNSGLNIGGLAVVAFWRSPHRPLGSVTYKEERGKKRAIFLPRPV